MNTHSDFASRMFLGRAFQKRGAVTKKDLMPIQFRPTCATISARSFDDVVIGPVTDVSRCEMNEVSTLVRFYECI